MVSKLQTTPIANWVHPDILKVAWLLLTMLTMLLPPYGPQILVHTLRGCARKAWLTKSLCTALMMQLDRKKKRTTHWCCIAFCLLCFWQAPKIQRKKTDWQAPPLYHGGIHWGRIGWNLEDLGRWGWIANSCVACSSGAGPNEQFFNSPSVSLWHEGA